MSTHKLSEGSNFLGIDEAIFITSTVYALTTKSHEQLLNELPKNGYTIEDSKSGKGQYAKLDVTHACSCAHCNHVQSSRGVLTHNKPCVSCNKPLYVEFHKGETITFAFVENGRTDRTDVTLKIFGYDEVKNEILLYPTPSDQTRSIFATPVSQQLDALDKNKGRYSNRNVIDNEQEINVLAIPFSHIIDENSVINTSRITGSKRYYSDVTIHNGVTYEMFDTLPLPDFVNISTQYMNKKLSLDDTTAHEVIMRAAGQVSRIDFYHQDGRVDFNSNVVSRMNAFVKFCVDADYKKWLSFIAKAPMDGPNFIRSLAKWCGEQSGRTSNPVREEPNMWNAINGALNQRRKGGLSTQEAVSAQDGLIHLAETFGVVIRDGEQNPTDILGDVTAIISAQQINNKPTDGSGGPK